MPLSKTLTMNLDVPEPWLVEPVIAVYVLSTSCILSFYNRISLNGLFHLNNAVFLLISTSCVVSCITL